jgi:hypothetical protein
MPSLVFGHVELIGIAIYTKGKLRKVVIVQTITADPSFAGLLVEMAGQLL